MNIPQMEQKYADLIKSIKVRRAVVYAITIAVTVSVILLTIPLKLELMGEVIADREGLHPALIALLAVLCVLVGALAYGFVSIPLVASLNQECDPEKQLILNLKINKRKDAYLNTVAPYFYLGEYNDSLNCAMKMAGSPKDTVRLTGLFNKSRCEFMLGHKEYLKMTAEQYNGLLKESNKISIKQRAIYEKLGDCISLMRAISENDGEEIVLLSKSVTPWNNYAATVGFINYLKGMSACIVGDRDEAVYRFRSVMEACGRTVLASLSERNLSLLD